MIRLAAERAAGAVPRRIGAVPSSPPIVPIITPHATVGSALGWERRSRRATKGGTRDGAAGALPA
jgi:hypothetical protein